MKAAMEKHIVNLNSDDEDEDDDEDDEDDISPWTIIKNLN